MTVLTFCLSKELVYSPKMLQGWFRHGTSVKDTHWSYIPRLLKEIFQEDWRFHVPLSMSPGKEICWPNAIFATDASNNGNYAQDIAVTPPFNFPRSTEGSPDWYVLSDSDP
jgi:hypothetical protein